MRTEQRREPAERFAHIARLAARLAHELSNPLAALKGNVEWLSRDQPSAGHDEQDADAIAEIRESLARIAAVAADLRDLASVTPREPAVRDVSRILAEAVRGLDDGVCAGLRVGVQPRLRALVDRVLLAQCLRHLVLGAAPLAAVAFESPLICIDAVREASGVVIELSATENAAATARDAARCLDKARRVQSHPTVGLHLVLADEFARAAGGTLDTIHSADGALRFRVRLPGADVVPEKV